MVEKVEAETHLNQMLTNQHRQPGANSHHAHLDVVPREGRFCNVPAKRAQPEDNCEGTA